MLESAELWRPYRSLAAAYLFLSGSEAQARTRTDIDALADALRRCSHRAGHLTLERSPAAETLNISDRIASHR